MFDDDDDDDDTVEFKSSQEPPLRLVLGLLAAITSNSLVLISKLRSTAANTIKNST